MSKHPSPTPGRMVTEFGFYIDDRHDFLLLKFLLEIGAMETVAVPGQLARAVANDANLSDLQFQSNPNAATMAKNPCHVDPRDRDNAKPVRGIWLDVFPNGILVNAEFIDRPSAQYAVGFDLAQKTVGAFRSFLESRRMQ